MQKSAPKSAAAFAAVLATGLAPAALAQSAHDAFYKDKTVKIMVGHSPGGSFDFYARLAADMLKKHLPGVASTIVENKPGGGGLVATAFFYANGAKDGTQLAVFPEGISAMEVFDPTKVRWKTQEMSYIGSFAPVNNVFIMHKDKALKDLRVMKTQEVIFGCVGVGSQGYSYPAMLKGLGGYKIKLVCGYPGSAELQLALDKREVDVASNAWNALRVTHADRIKSGEVVPIMQAGLKRNGELPNVPLLQDLLDGAEEKRIMEYGSLVAGIGRALIAPPGVPADRIAYLRGVFDKMVRDPEMVEMANKRRLEIDPTPGAEVQMIVDRIISAPKGLIDRAAAAMK
jgi:tripartite-type tricarboxylate transporter receptor subunit TctC